MNKDAYAKLVESTFRLKVQTSYLLQTAIFSQIKINVHEHKISVHRKKKERMVS